MHDGQHKFTFDGYCTQCGRQRVPRRRQVVLAVALNRQCRLIATPGRYRAQVLAPHPKFGASYIWKDMQKFPRTNKREHKRDGLLNTCDAQERDAAVAMFERRAREIHATKPVNPWPKPAEVPRWKHLAGDAVVLVVVTLFISALVVLLQVLL